MDIDYKVKTFEEFIEGIENTVSIPGLVNALKEITNFVKIENIKEALIIKRTNEDLFENLKSFHFRETNNISVFKTERGSIYLFAKSNPSDDYGVSIRLEISEDQEYYTVREPSYNAIFENKKQGYKSIPRIGDKLRETFGEEEWHLSSPIYNIDY
ncbi:MAG: hypothetical protein ABIM99_04235 [Candidatus Dojkabacteria bacterium]